MSRKILVSFVLFVIIFSSMALAVEKVVLTGTFAAPADRWHELISVALEELNKRHPDMEITMEYEVLPYDDTRSKLITLTAGKTPRDLVSVDQIWLGEFAQSGFLKDITKEVNSWGRIDEFYPANVDGSKFDGKFYSIWTWTDARVTWYWKDLLEEAGVDPEMLKTWDGYIEAYQKLAPVTMKKGILPMHLVAASHSPDMWFPYLWMNGGEILEQEDGEYYPAFYGEAGVKALTFLRDQVEAGIRPQVQHQWGQEFADKRFAVMIEGSWLLGKFPEGFDFNQIGMIPGFPVPEEGMKSSTMMGGWLLAIPSTSQHPELAWELMTIMLDPEVLTPVLAKYVYLPTQKTIAEQDPYKSTLENEIPFFEDLMKAVAIGKGRPNIPEYPQIAESLRIAIEEVYYGVKTPEDALKNASKKVEEILIF